MNRSIIEGVIRRKNEGKLVELQDRIDPKDLEIEITETLERITKRVRTVVKAYSNVVFISSESRDGRIQSIQA